MCNLIGKTLSPNLACVIMTTLKVDDLAPGENLVINIIVRNEQMEMKLNNQSQRCGKIPMRPTDLFISVHLK